MRRIDRICQKYGVQTIDELIQLAHDNDQVLMRSRKWNYKVDALHTRIVNEVKRVPRKELVGDEKWKLEQIIWFWYHHATSCAIAKHHDLEKALYFVKKALQYQKRIEPHPNKITRLLYLLLKEKMAEAKALVPTMHKDEIGTGRWLIRNWKKYSALR